MPSYKQAYANLNQAQKQAVDQTDGPVLVIAGPGTGKTQLLTTRIAHILATTDTLPENILCLTFTEAAATAMRDRLSSMIGQAAYNVTISTYHAFGSDILKRYPEFFSEFTELLPADELRVDQILRLIQSRLPYSNGLKNEVFLSDIKSLISDFKRALLDPSDVRAIAQSNLDFISEVTTHVHEHLGSLSKITKASIPAFASLYKASARLTVNDNLPTEPLARAWTTSLQEAIFEAEESGKTATITAWKNRWLAKDGEGQFIPAGQQAMQKQLAAADIYERYLKQLRAHGLYDYDDMILQAIRGLSMHDELRYTIQERFQYLLLDEFQDTNEAQLRLVYLLTDNPVNEGRPNVLAVGDDDQAIYAFQGADYSHMLSFYEHFTDTLVVPLTQNYRSHKHILQFSEGISGQIGERLHYNFPRISKQLDAANSSLKTATIERHEFASDLSQNAWVATQITTLISQGTPAKSIAVLAPKHQYLESLVPFLRQREVPIHYEKREDILEDPAIIQLLLMARLILSLAGNDTSTSNALWPQVLSLPIWQLETSAIWNISWSAREAGDWIKAMYDQDTTHHIALFFMQLSLLSGHESLETMLDYIIGITSVELREKDKQTYRSPYYEYYFGSTVPTPDEPVTFWQLLANITVLRQRLRDYKNQANERLLLADLLTYAQAHQAAGIKILNTNPYQEAENSVELMTAYKAKGREFDAVFVLALNDEVWGSRARTQAGRIAIPENLKHIRYAGASEDERLRLVYVAATRAKTKLYLTNFTSNFSGKSLSRLKYLSETTNDVGKAISPLLPAQQEITLHSNDTHPTVEDLSAYWHERHHQASTSPALKDLLQSRLQHFQLSATQLCRFVDTSIDGPTSFLLRDLLKFPSGSSLSGTYGDAIHECLSWIHMQVKSGRGLPTIPKAHDKLTAVLQAKHLSALETSQLIDRGAACIDAYIEQRAPQLTPSDYSEFDFRGEGVHIEQAHLTGKVDRLIVNEEQKTVTIVDFKTGKSHTRWTSDLKMHRYKLQLYFYKLLVEHSSTFRGYTVTDAYLEFVEPDENGQIQELHLTLNETDEQAVRELIIAVWRQIKQLDFPDVKSYGEDIKGTLAFEEQLSATTDQ